MPRCKSATGAEAARCTGWRYSATEQAAAWLPSEREIARSRLAAAMKRWGFDSLEALHKDSVDKPDWFWRAALDDLGMTFTTPWTSYIDVSGGHAFPRWFNGGRLNVATHCVERHAADAQACEARRSRL